MWVVTIYRDYGYHGENYSKSFDEEDEAYDYFEEEIRNEFDSEIEQGLIVDQEIQNILDNGIYRYETEKIEILIQIEEVEDEG